MLTQILSEIKAAPGPINLNELALKLGIERSALDGMIQFWVRKGRLRDDDLVDPAAPHAETCATGSCRATCPGPKACPFVMTMPRTFSLTLELEPVNPPEYPGHCCQ
jgi:hypothetical protein